MPAGQHGSSVTGVKRYFAQPQATGSSAGWHNVGYSLHRDPRDDASDAPRGRSKAVTMFTIFERLGALAKDQRGVTALEYGLIAGLVAVAIVTSVTALGTQLTATFTTITAALP